MPRDICLHFDVNFLLEFDIYCEKKILKWWKNIYSCRRFGGACLKLLTNLKVDSKNSVQWRACAQWRVNSAEMELVAV